MWEEKLPEERLEPVRKCVIHHDGLMLSVSVSKEDEGKIWQYCAFSSGAFSDASFDACLETWPAEAIARARAILDDLEAKLQGENDETDLERREIDSRAT